MAAAIQLKRYGFEPVLFEKNKLGGLLWNANLVENYPGFPGGITGPELCSFMIKQFESFEIEVLNVEVKSVEYQDQVFSAQGSKSIIESEFMIIASGTVPKHPEGLEIPESVSPSVFYEVIPLLKMKDKKIIIIGAGDAAFDYALNLSSHSNSVTILNRGKYYKCLPLLFDRASNTEAIKYHTCSRLLSVENGTGSNLTGIVEWSGVKEEIDFDYLLVAIGREPNTKLIDRLEEKTRMSLIENNQLQLIGDIKNGEFRQASIAISDGVMAAMKIWKSIQ